MPDPSKWLSNLWIIEINSGVCAFEQSFMEINLNPELISGFLIAMINFGKELASKDLQAIKFQNLKISLKMQPKYTIAVAVTDDAFSKEVEAFLELIASEFDKRYLKYFDNWAGRTDVFNDFGIYVENLVQKKQIPIEYVKSKVVKIIEDKGEKYKKIAQDNIHQIDNFIESSKKQLVTQSNQIVNQLDAFIEASKSQFVKFKDDKKDLMVEHVNKLKKKISQIRKPSDKNEKNQEREIEDKKDPNIKDL